MEIQALEERPRDRQMCLGKHVWVVYQVVSNILQTLTYNKINFSKDHRPQFKG